MKDSVCLTKSEHAFFYQTYSLKGHYDIHGNKYLACMRNKVKNNKHSAGSKVLFSGGCICISD